MKLKFNYKFTKKRILALCEAILAIATFFVYFAPAVYYYTTVGKVRTYYNGFESYLGKSSDFSATFGGVFFIILLFAFAGLCIAKMFVSDNKYKLFNILAILVAAVALLFIALAPTGLMINSIKDSSRITYAYGAFIQFGLTAGLIALVAIDQWVIKN
jgi:hypothetical protein